MACESFHGVRCYHYHCLLAHPATPNIHTAINITPTLLFLNNTRFKPGRSYAKPKCTKKNHFKVMQFIFFLSVCGDVACSNHSGGPCFPIHFSRAAPEVFTRFRSPRRSVFPHPLKKCHKKLNWVLFDPYKGTSTIVFVRQFCAASPIRKLISRTMTVHVGQQKKTSPLTTRVCIQNAKNIIPPLSQDEHNFPKRVRKHRRKCSAHKENGG